MTCYVGTNNEYPFFKTVGSRDAAAECAGVYL